MGRHRRDEVRVKLFELLDGEAMVIAGELDEAEVAGADDRDRGFVGRGGMSSSSRLTTPSVVWFEKGGPRHSGSNALARA